MSTNLLTMHRQRRSYVATDLPVLNFVARYGRLHVRVELVANALAEATEIDRMRAMLKLLAEYHEARVAEDAAQPDQVASQ